MLIKGGKKHPKRTTKECKVFFFYNLEVRMAFNKHLLKTYSLTLCLVLKMGTSGGLGPAGTQTSEGHLEGWFPGFMISLTIKNNF